MINHKPVLINEVIKYLFGNAALLHNSGKYIDATVGFGGHTIEILKRGGMVLGIDADQEALNEANKRLKIFPSHKYVLIKGNFVKVDEIAKPRGFVQVDGILYDLGVNIHQLTSLERGFSFQDEALALDMRIDIEGNKVRAEDLLNLLPEKSLVEIFSKIMTLNLARRLADRVVKKRKERPIKTVLDLKEIAKETGIDKGGKLNPLTKVFLALRIAVNSELENLKESLPKAFSLLKHGGRMVVVSFHSGEDRIVKNYFRDLKDKGVARIITEKPVTAQAGEIVINPSARSSKLRAAEKI